MNECLNKNTVDNFIIKSSLITPIENIIRELKLGGFRHCDIPWLDKKMYGFVQFAAKTLYLEMPFEEKTEGKVLNDFTKTQYIDRFTTLLTYFKTYID